MVNLDLPVLFPYILLFSTIQFELFDVTIKFESILPPDTFNVIKDL